MWIVLGLLALPLVEIGLFVTLGAKLGLWLTLGWVVLTGVLGVFLLKSMALAGGETLRRGFQEGLQDPLSPLAHRALVGVAGALSPPGKGVAPRCQPNWMRMRPSRSVVSGSPSVATTVAVCRPGAVGRSMGDGTRRAVAGTAWNWLR